LRELVNKSWETAERGNFAVILTLWSVFLHRLFSAVVFEDFFKDYYFFVSIVNPAAHRCPPTLTNIQGVARRKFDDIKSADRPG